MRVNYLAGGNTFMAQKWNNFYDGEFPEAFDIYNLTVTTLSATGQYWKDQTLSGPVDASSPQTSHNPDAGPGGGGTGKAAPAAEQPEIAAVKDFALAQNLPNPFNPKTKIRFGLPQAVVLSLTIFDVTGRKVRELVHQKGYETGWIAVLWEGKDDNGNAAGSGMYFYTLQAQGLETGEGFTDTQRLVLLR